MFSLPQPEKGDCIHAVAARLINEADAASLLVLLDGLRSVEQKVNNDPSPRAEDVLNRDGQLFYQFVFCHRDLINRAADEAARPTR